ncbi:MAG TPA: hypothetical protein VLV18_06720 [Terriglobales bacterium]|nr:hypothetical protein [Terriglobales bacterium]
MIAKHAFEFLLHMFDVWKVMEEVDSQEYATKPQELTLVLGRQFKIWRIFHFYYADFHRAYLANKEVLRARELWIT